MKAQIAADFLPAGEREKHLPALAFQSLARSANDQVEVATKAWLGLTVGCAQRHNHKYDPIPTQDYCSLLGVFQSSKRYEHPLADEPVVKEWRRQIDECNESLEVFVKKQSEQLGEILAAKTSRYLLAAWKVLGTARQQEKTTAQEQKLDEEIFKRLLAYLREPNKDHRALSGVGRTSQLRGEAGRREEICR